MFKDRDIIPKDDSTFIDFYDSQDKYNPFCIKNFISEIKLESENIEKAFSLVNLRWNAVYGNDKFKYVYMPMDRHQSKKKSTVTKWWADVEAEISNVITGLGSDFYNNIAQKNISDNYLGLSDDWWNIYGILHGITPVGQLDSRFQILIGKTHRKKISFFISKPKVSFCTFKFC